LCLAQIYQAKVEAAIAGLHAIVRVDEQREGMIADMQERINVRGGIIDDLKQVDKNSQRIDVVGQEGLAIMRAQHTDDKTTIASLQESLNSCRGNQKWIAGLSALGGGLVGYKLRGAGQFQNPFVFVPSSVTSQPLNFMTMPVTQADENLRRALKRLNQ